MNAEDQGEKRANLAGAIFRCAVWQPPHISVRCDKEHASLHKQFVRSFYIPISFVQEVGQRESLSKWD